MLNALTLILTCQLVGEAAARAAHLPVPGPVIGMVLLLIWLFARGGISDDLAMVGDGLLKHLSLLFVPAGVGVMAHVTLFKGDALPIVAALVLSTALTIAVTSLVMARLNRGRTEDTDGTR